MRWWLEKEVLPRMRRGASLQSVEIITGHGKSRPDWQHSDLHGRILQVLHGMKMPIGVLIGACPCPGRVVLDLNGCMDSELQCPV